MRGGGAMGRRNKYAYNFFILDPLPELSFSCLLIFSNFSASVLLLSKGGYCECFLNILCDLCQVYWEFSSLVRAYTASIRILGSNPGSWILYTTFHKLYLLFMLYNKMGFFSDINFGILRFLKQNMGELE